VGFRKIAPRGSANPNGHLVTGPVSMNLQRVQVREFMQGGNPTAVGITIGSCSA
jgi:hypothetical protein